MLNMSSPVYRAKMPPAPKNRYYGRILVQDWPHFKRDRQGAKTLTLRRERTLFQVDAEEVATTHSATCGV
jgi:hypothetical protein